VEATLGDVFVKVTTEDPWGFAVRREGVGDSICEVTLQTCAVLPPWLSGQGPRWLAVATADFDAGPANLTIEVVEEGATCP
jgi:hypothetical protein